MHVVSAPVLEGWGALPAEHPERLAYSNELGSLIEWAIDRLPDGAREVFILRQVEGMSTTEVADALDVSEAVVKTRLSLLWRETLSRQQG